MDVCCRDISKITSGDKPDFSVKELMLSFKMMGETVSDKKREQWLNDLRKVDPYVNYDRVYSKTDVLGNINIYNLVGEFLRSTEGLTDISDYFDKHWPLQFENFDENGMYIDPNAPILYDLTTRAQMQLILGNGYNGKYAEKLDEYLKTGGYMTLFLQTAAFQFPFGGRSSQYQYNEALIASVCEYEANRYKKLGDLKTAGVYKRCAHLAAQSISRWLDEYPPQHIKNFYPVNSKFGTEVYGYYDKYMVTVGCFIYIGLMFADDTISEVPCPAELGGYVFKTSPTFHKVFANCGGNSIEIELKADPHYDSTGIGCFHKCGVPTELALSVPFAAKHRYALPEELTDRDLSISAGWNTGDGEIQFLAQLNDSLKSEISIINEDSTQVKFSVKYTGEDFKGCNGVKETYIIDKNGVNINAELINPVINEIYYTIPLLVTNGKDKTKIIESDNKICVTMHGNCYNVSTEGELKVENSRYGNRNGEYTTALIKQNDASLVIQLELN